ncbi:MAG: hypothetical protein CMJ87_13205 [Planctomycetes bacterium]|nr:hypothetical protein [Planctomycetota bacterium]
MPNLPVGGVDTGSPLTAGRLEFGLAFTYGYRNSMKEGDQPAPNLEEAFTGARVLSLEAALGLWRGLGVRLGIPILGLVYSDGGAQQKESGVGDLWLRLGYTHTAGQLNGAFTLHGNIGVSAPTGSTVATDLPPNAAYASQTFNPLLGLDLGYDFRFGLGFFALGDARWVPYARDDRRAGSSITYGVGIRYQLFDRLFPWVGAIALHRFPDQVAGEPMSNSGTDTLYVGVGLPYAFRWKPLQGLALHATLMIPAYQHVNGMQLVEALNVTVGIRYGFNAWNPDPPTR